MEWEGCAVHAVYITTAPTGTSVARDDNRCRPFDMDSSEWPTYMTRDEKISTRIYIFHPCVVCVCVKYACAHNLIANIRHTGHVSVAAARQLIWLEPLDLHKGQMTNAAQQAS
jgi:hypothetical protein